jgi:hypothetical protein
MTKQRMKKKQINEIRDKKGDITTNTNEIQKIESILKTYI